MTENSNLELIAMVELNLVRQTAIRPLREILRDLALQSCIPSIGVKSLRAGQNLQLGTQYRLTKLKEPCQKNEFVSVNLVVVRPSQEQEVSMELPQISLIMVSHLVLVTKTPTDHGCFHHHHLDRGIKSVEERSIAARVQERDLLNQHLKNNQSYHVVVSILKRLIFFKSDNSNQAKRTSTDYSIVENLKERKTSGAGLEKSKGSEKAQANLLKLKNLIIESEKNSVSSRELSGSIKMSRSRSSCSKFIVCKEDRISGEIENNSRRRSNSSPTLTYSPAFTPTVSKPPRVPQKRDSPRTPICCNLEDSELMLEVTGNDISVLRAQTESVSDQKKQIERRKRMLEWKKRKRGVLTKDDQKKRKLNSSEPCTVSKSSSTQATADLSAISNDALEFDFSGGEDIEGAVHDKPCQPASYSMNSTSDDIGGKHKKDSEDEITADEWDVSKHGCRRLEPHYTIKNLLDSGTYGTVFRAVCNKTGEIYALKKIKMQQSKDGFPITSLRELALLMEIDHQNVVKAIEIVVSKRNIRDIFMVMEFCDHDFGALLKIKKQPFALSELKCLMQQLLSGLSYMHANWMLHRDLKPSNLLLNSKGILKICDFGMARRYGSPIEPYTPNCCTLWYQSPEMLMGVKTYTTAVDCWSVGVIMAQLVLGRPLFKGGTAFAQLKEILKILGTPDESTPGWNGLEEVKKWKFKFYTPRLRSLFMPKGPTLTQSCRLSSEGFNCLNKLLQWDPTFRLTASEALKHDWFVETPRPCTPDLLPTFPKLNEQKRSRAIRQYKSDMKLKEQMLREKGGFHMGV